MDNLKKNSDGKLPELFSSLNDKSISEKYYLHAIDVWIMFKMRKMGDYHDRFDVLFLVDVFEKFIDMCLEYYGLHPCHYFSSPGLSRDAMLKMTGIELEIISKIDMYVFVEK